MKKAGSVLVWFLFLLTVLYPAGVIIADCFGYRLELRSVLGFAIVLAVLSVGIVALAWIDSHTFENRTTRILLALITPFSLLNAVLCIFVCPNIWVVVSLLSSAGCCCYFTARYGKPAVLKNIALVLFALMIFPVGLFSFFILLFGNIAQNTVVKTVESPSGRYYAQVIDRDEGALGGDTHVDVYRDGGIDAFLFKIEKKPQQVYFGRWGEFENMKIEWKDDHCLVINGVKYEIE